MSRTSGNNRDESPWGWLILIGALLGFWLLIAIIGWLYFGVKWVYSETSSLADKLCMYEKRKTVESIRSGNAVPRGWQKGEWETYKVEHPSRADEYLEQMLQLSSTERIVNRVGTVFLIIIAIFILWILAIGLILKIQESQ